MDAGIGPERAAGGRTPTDDAQGVGAELASLPVQSEAHAATRVAPAAGTLLGGTEQIATGKGGNEKLVDRRIAKFCDMGVVHKAKRNA